jgi:oligopeptide transport system substrate-binding protein
MWISGFIKRISIFFLCIWLCHCTEKMEVAVNKPLKQDYNILISKYPTNFDPSQSDWPEPMQIINMVFSTLIRLDATGDIVPGLAKEWSISPDGKIYTFSIRDDIFFHNSRKLIVEDIIYSFERLSRKESIYKNHLQYLKGYGNSKLDTSEAFKKINDNTFSIELQRSFSPFLKMLSTTGFSIIPKEESLNNPIFFQKPIGTGPFKFKTNTAEKFTFERFPLYYKGKPKLEIVNVIYEKNLDKQKEIFKKGGIHQALDLVFSENELDKNKFKEVFISEQRIYYLGFNIRKHPISNIHFRKALRHSIDFTNLSKKLNDYKNLQPSNSFIPKGMFGFDYSLKNSQSFNSDTGKNEFRKTGLDPTAIKPLVFSINLPKPASEFIIHAILDGFKNLGLEVQIDTKWPSLRTLQPTENTDFYMLGTAPNFPDPYFLLNYFYSTSEKNDTFSGYTNFEFNNLLKRYIEDDTYNNKIDILKQLNRKLIDEIIVIPLFSGSASGGFFKKEVRGLEFPFVNYPFPLPEKIWLE